MADIPCGQFCTMRCVTSTKVLSGKPTAEAMPVCEIQLHTQYFAHGALQVPSSARTWRGQSGGVGTWQARVIAGGITWCHVPTCRSAELSHGASRAARRQQVAVSGGVGRRRAASGGAGLLLRFTASAGQQRALLCPSDFLYSCPAVLNTPYWTSLPSKRRERSLMNSL